MDRLSRGALALLLLAAAPRLKAQDDDAARRLAAELVPAVEHAVGLRFKRTPDIEVRSREQVRAYLARKLVEELPPPEMVAVQRAYRVLGLAPDTLDLRRLMLDLYSEQVAGYYDPDSTALFVVRGFDPIILRVVMGHELVHALQDQYMPLNAIVKLKRQNDRQMAGQAVAEGQAMLASLEVVAPGVDLSEVLGDESQVRGLIAEQRGQMPVFASAPRIIQESLLFPYISGLQFMRAFEARRTRPDEEPYGDRLPISTAQILHPELYANRTVPERVGFGRAPAGDTLVYDDDLGEFESRVALETWGVDEATATAAATGWDGDRFEVLGDAAGTAVIWAAAWTSSAEADQFQRALVAGWAGRTGAPGRTESAEATGATYGPGRSARRWRVDHFGVRGENVVRLVDAPAAWAGWTSLPAVALTRFAR